MNIWLATILKSDWARTSFPEKLASTYPDWLTFKPRHVSAHLHDDFIMFSAQAADYYDLGRPACNWADLALVFDGVPRPGNYLPPRMAAAKALANLYRRSTPETVYRILHGEYSLAAWRNSKRSLAAFSDFSGIRPIYYMETRDLVAVSNSLYLLNPVCTRSENPSFAPLNAASLVAQGNLFGSRSILQGIKLLPPGMILSATTSGVTEYPAPDPFYGASEVPSAADFDRASDILVSNFDWLKDAPAASDGALELSLTGGEDSRLVLALAMNSSVRGAVKSFTYGDDSTPDVIVARQVAERAGVDHETKPMGGGGKGGQFDQYWSLMRSQAFRFAAHHGAVDGSVAVRTATVRSDITGIGDHFYKRIRDSNARADLKTREELFDHLLSFQGPHDPLALLTAEAEERHREGIDRFINDAFAKGATLNDAPELYYVENRATWWTGVMQAATVHRQRLFPLLDRFAARVGVAQKLEDRRKRRFIFEIMRRLAPELMSLPLVNKVYDPAYAQAHPELSIPGSPFAAPPAPNRPAPPPPWTVQVVKHGVDRLRSYLLDGAGSPLFDIVRRDQLEAVLNDTGRIKIQPEVKALLNLAQLQMLFTQDWTATKDDITGFEPPYPKLETNINAFRGGARSSSARPSASHIRSVRISLPAGLVRAVRLDPMDRPGRIRLHAVELLKAGRRIAADLSKMRAGNGADLKPHPDGSVTIVSAGDDPQCRFPDLEAEGPFDVRETTRLLVMYSEGPPGGNIEAFFDLGEGFTRQHMARAGIGAFA